MAKKKKKKGSDEAIYDCTVSCTYNLTLADGKVLNHFYRSVNESTDRAENSLSVPAGTIVCKHFTPANEQAELDRDDQMENPHNYVKSRSDIMLLAEIMVKKGFFSRKNVAIKEIEKTVNVETLGVDDPEEMIRIAAVADLMNQHDDDKDRRKAFNTTLKAGGVAGYFKGSDPQKLAEMVFDNGLYDKPE